MKTRISMLAVAAMSMLSFMTSCDSESLELGSDSVMLEAEVSSVAKVRSAVEGTTLPAGSNYGLYVLENGSIVAPNIKMSANSTATGYEITSGHEIQVGAYYPYDENTKIENNNIYIYPGTTDYLHTVGSSYYTKSNPKAKITLHHALARVKFNVSVASDVETAYAVELSAINNVAKYGSMSLLSDYVDVYGNVYSSIYGTLELPSPIKTTLNAGQSAQSEVFLLPLTFNSQYKPSISILINEESKNISADLINATASGKWESGKVYTYNITISEGTKVSVSSCTIEEWGKAEGLEGATAVLDDGSNGHKYVDLGLPSGTLWATCNIGASSPEQVGDYYAWGEIETKNDYSWSTYKWCNGTENTLTKYCGNSEYGTVDNKTELDLEDDVAYVKWGGNWRMPTNSEISELMDLCTWTWTNLNSVSGYKVVGKNGNSIFLPMTGWRDGTATYSDWLYGMFLSSTLYSKAPRSAYYLKCEYGKYNLGANQRRYGHSVRPVIRK